MEEVSCSDLFSEGQSLGLELAIEIRAIVLRVKQAGGWRLEVGGIRLVTEDHSKDVLFPPRLRVSA
jgi:hypothetical protein